MQTEIIAVDSPQFERLIQALKAGELVGMPTETVYGLAGDAFNPRAVAQIFAVKERPKFDPLIVHLPDHVPLDLRRLEALELIDLKAVPKALQTGLKRLMKSCWPGPLTLVLPRHARIPDLVTAGLNTVALRVPHHPAAQQVLQHCPALAAPSANRFGRISPTTAQAVLSELGGRIPWILDGGACEIGVESSIVGLHPEGCGLELLRAGRYGLEELQEISGLAVQRAQQHPAEIRAPGMLKSHYAPDTSLRLFDAEEELPAGQKPGQIGVLFCTPPGTALRQELERTQQPFWVLAPDRQIESVAQNLFAGLRTADNWAVEQIWAQRPEGKTGLAHAVRDRLQRAAST